ncbi:hypothetical protein ASG53_09520 [Sanguibacter sp. Leaf3]|nr:hypothetical protein ASG53_09520 [Sanguibacter sp. Leaf3]
MARDAADRDTPARRATSSSVGRLDLWLDGRLGGRGGADDGSCIGSSGMAVSLLSGAGPRR